MINNSNRGGGSGGGRGSNRGGGASGGSGSSRGGSSSGGAGRGSGGSQFHSSRPSSSRDTGSSSSGSGGSASGSSSYSSRAPSYGAGRGTGFNSQSSQLSFGNREAIEGVSIKTIKIDDLSNVVSQGEVQEEKPANSTTSRAVVNYFPVKAPEGPFYLYDVKIEPQVDSKYFAGKLIYNILPKNEIYLFDGTTVLYTKNPLTKNKEPFEKTHKDKKVYKITINFARSVTSVTIDATTLQFMNIILRRAQSSLHLQRIGRHYYNTNEKVVANIPSHNIKILPGALSTTFLGRKGLMLNVDMIYKTLRTDTVYSMLRDLITKFNDNHERIASEFRNTIVLCTYNQRTIHIDDVDFDKTPNSTFVKKTGEKITFAKYYEEQYKIKVKDMKQPLLKHVDRKDPQRVEYYLPELCLLTGLTDEMRKNQQLMRALKSATGLTPNQRIRQIVHSQQECLQNKEYTNQLSEWGLEVNDKLLEVETTVLPTETVEFGGKVLKTATGASWEVKRDKLYKPIKIESWCVFFPNGNRPDTENFIKMLSDVSRPIGMTLGTPKFVEISDNEDETYADEIQDYLTQNKMSFALVVLYNDRKQRYSRVKEVLCNQIGVISQCVKLSTISNEKGLASKATKVIVQVCSKMGGAPWTVPLAFPNKEPTMIIGMDVYHSGEIYKRKKASVAGFVASIDSKISTYFTKCIIQEAGKEIVDELEGCMTDALNKFKEKNKIFPRHIIFYRDGVGEGQKEAVLEREVTACKKAIMTIAPTCKLNYIVVSKRINTRIFAISDPNKPTDFTNPIPGTVLDYGVTSQREDSAIEFYLVAQKVDNGQGTATPTKYHSLFNGSVLTKSYLETLSFRLCHNYYNWFGTIRVPSPCMYAHKIASLVGQYTKSADFKDVLNDKLFYL